MLGLGQMASQTDYDREPETPYKFGGFFIGCDLAATRIGKLLG